MPRYYALRFRTLPATLLLLFAHMQGGSAAENAAFEAALSSITRDEAKVLVEALADDIFEGREAGARGGRAAAGYLVDQLKQLDVRPAGTTDEYYQPFGGNYRNILVAIDGADAELAKEWIVVSAHYDHVGYGNSRNSYGPTGYIHNGADDNASGTAALLEVIEAFSASGIRPRRSLLFVFFDAEEQGLLGSKHWVGQPTVPLEKIPVMVNVDMVGRLREQRLTVHGTRSAAGLRQIVSRQNPHADLRIDFTWKNRANSDHYPFFERNIPFLMLHTGLHDDYHRPSDDADKLNLDGIEQAARLLFALTHELATRESLPGFRAAARGESEWQRRRAARRLAPAAPRLGVRWSDDDENVELKEGLVLTEVVPGYAAYREGLRTGDRVLEFAGERVTSGLQFRGLILWATSPVAVRFVRGEGAEPQLLSVNLDGPPVRLGISFRTDEASPGEMIVNRVTAGSPAARAGLKLRDRIYRVGERTFADRAEFLNLVNTLPSPIPLLVEREGYLQTLTLDVPPLREPVEDPATAAPAGEVGETEAKTEAE